MVSWEHVFAIIPGIILFLYGIGQFSREVQLAAGEYLRGCWQQIIRRPYAYKPNQRQYDRKERERGTGLSKNTGVFSGGGPE